MNYLLLTPSHIGHKLNIIMINNQPSQMTTFENLFIKYSVLYDFLQFIQGKFFIEKFSLIYE